MADQQPICTERNENGSHPVYVCKGEVPSIHASRFPIPLKLAVHDIDVVVDNGFAMLAQVSNACHCAYDNFFCIAKIRASVTTAACRSLLHSLVMSHLDYNNVII